MRHFKTEAIIIKRRNYRDADRILTAFTKEYGKLQIRASGVRKITSRRSAHIELLNHSVLSLYKAHAYPVLTEAQTVDAFPVIKNDLVKVGHAYYLCELVDGLCPENQELRQVFALLKATLEKLSSFSPAPSSSLLKGEEILLTPFNKGGGGDLREGFKIIHDFEIELLSLLGYWNRASSYSHMFDTERFIEDLIERKLKSKSIFAKLQ